MQIQNINQIPSLDLMHNNERVSFAFRTMEEIHERIGNTPDLPHRHDYYTILWAKNVCGQHFIDYKEYPIRPNYLFFVNPGQVHQVITYGQPSGYVILFTREFLSKNFISEEFLTDLGLFSCSPNTPPIELEDEAGKKLTEIVLSIESTFRESNSYREEVLAAYLKIFLVECNKYAPQPETSNTQIIQSGRFILKDFRSLVEKKYAIWHKVGNYSEQLNITADYLNNVIKSSIGKTAKEFIQERIILESKRLGLHTNLSTKEIAFQLGFEDPSHFSKFFKNIEEHSFSDFRAKLEKSIADIKA